MAEWDPEVELDADAARRLIEGRFPDLRGVSIELLDAGWDNVVHLVDEKWAFRFPRRAVAVRGVEREITVLPRLAAHLPLPIPEPHWIGEPSDEYGWPWFGTRYLPGRELATETPADDDRREMGAALGAFLRALHASRLARLVGGELPVDPNRRSDMAWRVPMARQRLATLAQVEGFEPPRELLALLADAEGLPPSSRLRVVHGDLHARHVLVAADGRITAIIDWGDVCLGDPSIDLSIAYASFAGDAREELFANYGPIDRLTELRARALAVFLSSTLLAYAVDQDMEALRDESRRALSRVVA